MKSKNIIMATILTGSCLLLSGCTLDYKEGSTMNDIFIVEKIYVDDNWNKIYEIKDKNTGIHYYRFPGSAGGITPVIESDGSIRGASKAKKELNQKAIDKRKLQIQIEEAEKDLNKKKEEYLKLEGE